MKQTKHKCSFCERDLEYINEAYRRHGYYCLYGHSFIKKCDKWCCLAKNDFTECDSCRAKPGTPVLCSGCVINRDLISELKAKIKRMADVLND